MLFCLTVITPTLRAQLVFITNNGAITITGSSGSPANLVIPATTNGLPVVNIADSSFQGQQFLRSVTIPNSVTNIGNYAFNFCQYLTNITFGTGLKRIGNSAFAYNYALRNVIIPNSVTFMGGLCFSDCIGLTNITLGSGVTNVGLNPFIADYALVSIQVNTANPAYSSLGGVLFNKNYTNLVQYPGGKIGNYTVTNSVRTIDYGAFELSPNLTGIITSNKLVSIGLYAFANCTSLTNVVLGAGVTNIGAYAFGGDTKLLNISVATNNPSFTNYGGILFNKSRTTLVTFPQGKSGSYTVTNPVTNIGFGAFSSCENLTNIVIGDSVTNIEAAAFFGCLNLTNITLGAGLRTMGNDPFDECYALTTFTISPSNSVFASQDGLLFNKDKTVLIRCSEAVRGNCIIPASVTEIKSLAFLNVFNIKKLYFLGDAPTVNGYTFSGNSPICYLPGTTGWGATYSGIESRGERRRVAVGE